MNLKIKDILMCTNGILVNGDENIECEDFSVDTRDLEGEDTYIGLQGKTFDGNTFWEIAVKKGVKTIIVEKNNIDEKDIKKYKDINIIEVQDTKEALKQIANAKRLLYKDLIVVGITGSVGKTSTKDIVASVLSQKYNTLKTIENNNNDVGVPLTILRLKEHEVAVVEMGMNHSGEISELTRLARPTLSVITNVGTSHIGNLGSRENILKAKLEILEGMEQPKIIINNDNDLLNKWENEEKENIEVHTFGINNESECMASEIKRKGNETVFICKYKNEEIKIDVPIRGRAFVLNSLCATLVGKLLNLSNEQIKNGILNFELTKRRMEIVKIKNNITLINDSYNASLDSMKESIKYLSEANANRKIAVLGDMFELGKFSEELHRKVGVEVAKNKIDILYIIGDLAKYIKDEAIKCGMDEKNIYEFSDRKELMSSISKEMKEGDIVLFKASNGMRLFDIVENLKSNNKIS